MNEDKDNVMNTDKDTVIIEGSEIETAPADKQDEKPKKNSKFKELFGDKPVSRKFLSIALAVTLLLNAGISAGLMALFGHNNKNMNGPDMNGRPGNEQSFGGNEQNNGGGMTPPGSNGQSAPGSDDQQQQQQGSNQNKVSIGIVITEDQGVYIAQVTGDNAKKAGFEEGDKIVSFDGASVSSSDELISAVQKHSAGDTVTVTVERDGQQLDITTELE